MKTMSEQKDLRQKVANRQAVNAEWQKGEYDRFRAMVKRIYESSWWSWADMQEMEIIIPGLTERLALTYGVTMEQFEMMLSNGKGFYLTPDLKEDFYRGFYYE